MEAIAGFVLIAFVLGSFAFAITRWLKLRKLARFAKHWPSTEATIQSADIEIVNSDGDVSLKFPCFAFSYKVNGEYYSGRFSLVLGIEIGEFLTKQMVGQKLQVQYDPANPSTYLIPQERMEGYELKQKFAPHLFALYPKD